MIRFLALPALALAVAGALPAADPLPLEPGNYWVYREERSGQSFTIRVSQPVWFQDGRTYHYLSGYAGDKALVRYNEFGNLVSLNEETGQESIVIGFGERAPGWWASHGRPCEIEGQIQRGNSTYEGPSGRWAQATAILYRTFTCADAGVTGELFTENIGMLRRTETSFAGPRTFDLVYARVGNQTIETRDRARFSVSVEQPLDKDELRVTLRIDLGYTPSIRLNFPTSQTFDVALRDESGRIVWAWSDGRGFAQVFEQRPIGNVWSETISIPGRAADLQNHTIEGWLTTAPGEAKFAATVPMPAPRIAGAEKP